jgi:hypothetical protein
LQLIEANESASGDAALSLKYARSALEHYSLSQAGPNNTLQESKLQFLCGRLIYKYILYLAGGVQHASSPPIAILPPSTNQPTIKSLLEESLDMLDEASKVAEIGKHDANCKEAVKIQMAFVAAELRMESHTKKILQDLNVDKSLLTEFDDSVKQHRQHRTHPYLAHVVYSPKVLKRVVLMMTEQPTVRKLTLSRKRTMNFDQPQKVLCSYCSMQCINTDLKCEYCAVGKVFVWYCTDECQSDHAQQHESQCLKNKTGNSLDFRSFLNVLTPT